MKEHKKKSLIPVLRFPEFRNQPGWKPKELKDACEMQTGKFVRASDVHEHKGEGLFPCYGGHGLRGYTKTYTHKGKYLLIGRQGALCGNITCVKGKFYATEHAIVVTPKSGVATDWLYYELILLNLSQYAKGQSQPGLSVEGLGKVTIKLPGSKQEQQKIANCLASIDQLIIAQNQKITALKAYRQSLMQRLFPTEGETTPKLRFPEFYNNGEWSFKTLEQLTTMIGSGTHETPKYDEDGSYFFVNGGDFVDGKIQVEESKKKINAQEAKLHQQNLSGQTVLLSIKRAIGGLAIYNGEKIVLSESCAYINLKDNVEIGFIYNSLMSPEVSSFFFGKATGLIIKNLSLKAIRETKISIPNISEQQKISNFLFSLDNLISVENQRIEALRVHEKGLMQQLFPSMEADL